MYTPARPASKPWRISRNDAFFLPDKMTRPYLWHLGSEAEKLVVYRMGLMPAWKMAHPCYTAWVSAFRRSETCKVMKRRPCDRVFRRHQRKQQRRLNAYLCRPDTPEWDVLGIEESGSA